MCANCLTSAEAVAAHAALAAALLRAPAHRFLAGLGLVEAPDPVRRDRRTVAFLRALDLDPVEILGAEVVAAADGASVPAPAHAPALGHEGAHGGPRLRPAW